MSYGVFYLPKCIPV